MLLTDGTNSCAYWLGGQPLEQISASTGAVTGLVTGAAEGVSYCLLAGAS